MKPDKDKDQHIMTDSRIIKEIVGAASVQKTDKVLEIGGGPGNLTELLAKQAGAVFSVEKDRQYLYILKEKFAGSENVRILQGDILDVELPGFNKIVSNPPYQILQPFFYRLARERRQGFDCCVMTVPYGFAKLIARGHESKDFGLLSALFYAFYEIEALASVPKEAFSPKPRVTSCLIKITPKKSDSSFLRAMLKSAFLHSNRKISNVMLNALWNGAAGTRITKKEARQTVSRLQGSVSEHILSKNIFQLSDYEVRKLSKELAGTSASMVFTFR